MLTGRDFRELLNLFQRHSVRFLLVDGYAVMRYSEPRFTKGLDLWISPQKRNAKAVYAALGEFGAPLKGLEPDDFSQPGYFYQLGKPPLRVDVMMSIPGVDFEGAWERRDVLELDGLEIPFICRSDLIRAKRAGGRPQDLLDAAELEEAARLDEESPEGF